MSIDEEIRRHMTTQPVPRISIVIAVLNAAEELRTTLRSVEAQSVGVLERIEVVIADGGSTVGTLEVARSSSLRTNIVSEPDRGIYDAMNKGAARATGSWLHFLNAGDAFNRDDALQIVLDDLEQADHHAASWYIAGARFVGGPVDGLRIPNLPHAWRRHALGLQPHCHQATWFRADVFAALGGYSLDFGFVGDFDLILRWGVLSRPYTNEVVLIDYLYGGLSEQRALEIPGLTRRVREERLQLDPMSLHLDDARIRVSRAADRTWHVLSRTSRFARRLMTGGAAVRPIAISDTRSSVGA